MSRAPYAERHSFGTSHAYRENAWLQDEYNKTFITEVLSPQLDVLLQKCPDSTIRVLDLCCGDGFTSIFFFKILAKKASQYHKTIEYTGIDISEQQIADSQRMLSQEDLTPYQPSSLYFLKANAETYRISNDQERVDLIVCFFGLHLLENVLETVTAIIKNAAKKDVLFSAILPLRVAIAYRAREQLAKTTWGLSFKDKIRFISEDLDIYKKIYGSLSVSNAEQENNFEYQTFSHTMTQERFLSFFKSWAPELRGVLSKDEHSSYLNALWETLKSFHKKYETEGFVSEDGNMITFSDRIISLTTHISTPCLNLTADAKSQRTAPLNTDTNLPSHHDNSASVFGQVKKDSGSESATGMEPTI